MTPDYGEGWAGEPHECECDGPDDSCPACSQLDPNEGGQREQTPRLRRPD
jgi:hypothetical protein